MLLVGVVAYLAGLSTPLVAAWLLIRRWLRG